MIKNKKQNKTLVVSFSGGRTSAYLVYLMEQKRLKEGLDVNYIFMDTGAEHPETYTFIRNMVKYWNIPLVCIRLKLNPVLGKGNSYNIIPIDEIGPDLQPWRDMLSKYGVPYVGGAFCTDRMKLKPFTEYCKDTFGKGEYETWLGIRADEPSRLVGATLAGIMKKAGIESQDVFGLWKNELLTPEYDYFEGMFTSNHINYNYKEILEMLQDVIKKNDKNGIRFLAEISDFEKQDVVDFWKSQPFDLNLPEHLGNCVFCIKKSDLKLAAAVGDEPMFYKQYMDVLRHESVRTGEGTGSVESMYRGKNSLENIIAKFDGSTGEEIKGRLRGAKMMETGSCSESCEVFSCSLPD